MLFLLDKLIILCIESPLPSVWDLLRAWVFVGPFVAFALMRARKEVVQSNPTYADVYLVLSIVFASPALFTLIVMAIAIAIS